MRFPFFFFLFAVIAGAAERSGQPDIDYLLGYIARTDCRFIRGGKEYGGKEAADHLRSKLSHAGARVQTAEQFIDGLASKSYLTGEPYSIKTNNGQISPAGEWLRQALVQHRKSIK